MEKIKTHILCSVTFFRKSCRLWNKFEKYGGARGATNDGMLDKQGYMYWRACARLRTRAHARVRAHAQICLAKIYIMVEANLGPLIPLCLCLTNWNLLMLRKQHNCQHYVRFFVLSLHVSVCYVSSSGRLHSPTKEKIVLGLYPLGRRGPCPSMLFFLFVGLYVMMDRHRP